MGPSLVSRVLALDLDLALFLIAAAAHDPPSNEWQHASIGYSIAGLIWAVATGSLMFGEWVGRKFGY